LQQWSVFDSERFIEIVISRVHDEVPQGITGRRLNGKVASEEKEFGSVKD